MDDMSVRSWQNTLVSTYVAAVKSGNPIDIRMAAHNLAVHVAHTRDSFEVMRQVLMEGAGISPAKTTEEEEETDTASMFWDKLRKQGLLERVSMDDQEYARTPWPVKDCD